MYLDRSINFLKARKTRDVPVPEFGDGCILRIRELSVGQMATLDKDLVRQLSMMIVDEDGNQVFRTAEDLANLAEMPADVSNRIFQAANEMNGTSVAAREDTLKN